MLISWDTWLSYYIVSCGVFCVLNTFVRIYDIDWCTRIRRKVHFCTCTSTPQNTTFSEPRNHKVFEHVHITEWIYITAILSPSRLRVIARVLLRPYVHLTAVRIALHKISTTASVIQTNHNFNNDAQLGRRPDSHPKEILGARQDARRSPDMAAEGVRFHSLVGFSLQSNKCIFNVSRPRAFKNKLKEWNLNKYAPRNASTTVSRVFVKQINLDPSKSHDIASWSVNTACRGLELTYVAVSCHIRLRLSSSRLWYTWIPSSRGI